MTPDVLQIIFTIAFGWLSDRTNWRASLVVVQEVTLAFGAIILACWPSSFGFKMFAYFTLWLSNAAGPILIVSSSCHCTRATIADWCFSLQAWMADLTPSPEERSVIIGVCITLLYVVDSFANSSSPPFLACSTGLGLTQRRPSTQSSSTLLPRRLTTRLATKQRLALHWAAVRSPVFGDGSSRGGQPQPRRKRRPQEMQRIHCRTGSNATMQC